MEEVSDQISNLKPQISNLKSILKKYWGYDSFRGIQLEIIESICSGHDTLGLMPTGGGKSITFQVPALAMDGVCIVITPLIALMKDQVFNLRRRRIRAAAIYSGMNRDDMLTAIENAIFGQLKLLYVSPERLGSELFRTKLRRMPVSFICVDEAHCISQWGYDFRPAYLTIADIRRDLPGKPVLALTATATLTVIRDICDKLTVPQAPFTIDHYVAQKEIGANVQPSTSIVQYSTFNIFRMSFERKNLAYIVRSAADKRDELIHILQNVPGTAIVYVRSRRRAKEVSDYLNAQLSTVCPTSGHLLPMGGKNPLPDLGAQAANGRQELSTFYHAGLDTITKDERQQMWHDDHVRVMVATNAFGMGIDKPDVRLVVHIDCPDSVEAYFQEAGRAGRDGKKAYAVLLYNASDRRKLLKRIGDTFPPKEYVREVYDHLAFYYQIATGSGYKSVFEFDIDDFCRKFRHFPIQVYSALQILSRAGYIDYIEEQESQARVMFILERDDLYRLQHTNAHEERVVTALLRNYGGLFVDYQFIDEASLAHDIDLTVPEVYLALKSLAQKRILRFIPQKRTPYIRYAQRREDSENLIFPPSVYEDLKQRHTERINAMIDYVENDNQCRSRQLLRYFGEETRDECHQCDVCLCYEQKLTNPEQRASAQQLILNLLGDGKSHHITELRQLPLPYEQLDVALSELLSEEQVYTDDGFLRLPVVK